MTMIELPRPTTVEGFREVVSAIEALDGYRRPAAFAVGWATTHRGVPVFCQYPDLNLGENYGSAALLANVTGYLAGGRTEVIEDGQLANVWSQFGPFYEEWRKDPSTHPNMSVVNAALMYMDAGRVTFFRAYSRYGLDLSKRIVVTFIDDLDAPPVDAYDAFLRLHLLSGRKVKPHEINLDGIFGLLSNVVWTDLGPFLAEDFESLVRLPLLGCGVTVTVQSVDKFPPMLNCVVPSGVRVADAARVRLGAHLAESTTVMQEGFVNFNAGTLGPAMIEGRLSAGVTVGANTDIGGGVSTQGTLSGGNGVVVSIGEDCLAEAESGVGIPLGDRVRIEAGFYLKSTTPVYVVPSFEWSGNPHVETLEGATVKASQLSGISDAIFRRNADTGRVEVIPRGNHVWGKLNPELHAN